MNAYIAALIVVPVIFSILYMLGSNRSYYKLLSYLLFIFGATVSILLAFNNPGKVEISGSTFTITEYIVMLFEILILLYFYRVSIKHKRWNVLCLTVISTILTIYTTFFMPNKPESVTFNVDSLSIIMALIINIVGTLIIVFANGYMDEYEHHRHMKSRQRMFYPILSIFIAAMNGLVLSDSLSWVFFFWEITTLASFLLISYNQDEEGFNSGFRALFLNLIGGIAFSVGIILFSNHAGITTFSGIIENGAVSGFMIIPVFLLCIAGFAKSAQLPFQSWLLGAMVAPTPVSALLHSSTMVKAGVYLIVKLSPSYAGTTLGTAVALFGAISFILCSAIAISQRNAKRVLAYSTIANLGLIITSAGMGTSAAISAAMILIVFHAISKALLFLCTGQIEHTVGSRDIEEMHGLVHIAPALAGITAFGILSMILPPFGVLVSKWLSIEVVAENPFVAILVILGSALTTLFWLKWLGTILSYPITNVKAKREKKNNFDVYGVLSLLSILAVVTSIFITPLNNWFVTPEIKSLLNISNDLSINNGNVVWSTGSFNNLAIFIIVGALVVVSFVFKKLFVTSAKVKPIYMCGENNMPVNDVTTNNQHFFRAVDGTYERSNVGNFYLPNVFSENILTNIGYVISIFLLLFVLIGGLL